MPSKAAILSNTDVVMLPLEADMIVWLFKNEWLIENECAQLQMRLQAHNLLSLRGRRGWTEEQITTYEVTAIK